MRHTLILLSVLPVAMATLSISKISVNAQVAHNGQDASSTAWSAFGGTQENKRYSPLTQINSENVKNLKPVWALQLGDLRTQEATPIVIGNTMYVPSSNGPKYVYALDVATGKVKWTYEPQIPEDILQYACCDANTRGVSYSNGKLLVGRSDGYLVALDANKGTELWSTQVVDYKQGSIISSPPVIADDVAVIGFGGGEFGARGYLSAYDLETGKQRWKTWTVPSDGEPGNETWKGDSWKRGGGAAWGIGSFDSKTHTVFYGTSNPAPWNNAVRSVDGSNYGSLTNLYTSSTLALDSKSGKIKWHIQTTPNDAWDYDGVNESVLADIEIDHKPTPVLMHADRNGFFYIADRASGQLISADPFVYVNWAKSIDLKSARPVEVPEKRKGKDVWAKDFCPSFWGGKNWQPMSFNPNTRLVYIPTMNMCSDLKGQEVQYRKGFSYLGVDYNTHPNRNLPSSDQLGKVIAWDPVARKEAWSFPLNLPYGGGTLSTGGNLVFFGDPNGVFHALDAKTGISRYSFNIGTGIIAAPMTFSSGGKQYIAIVAGRAEVAPAIMGDIGKAISNATPPGGLLMVFAL